MQDLFCVLEKQIYQCGSNGVKDERAGGEDVRVDEGLAAFYVIVRTFSFVLRLRGSHWKIPS